MRVSGDLAIICSLNLFLLPFQMYSLIDSKKGLLTLLTGVYFGRAVLVVSTLKGAVVLLGAHSLASSACKAAKKGLAANQVGFDPSGSPAPEQRSPRVTSPRRVFAFNIVTTSCIDRLCKSHQRNVVAIWVAVRGTLTLHDLVSSGFFGGGGLQYSGYFLS